MTRYRDLPETLDNDLKRLIITAENCARWRNHTLDWTVYNDHNAVGKCSCGSQVQVLTHSMPNQIDIGGSAVAINCPHTK